ncbi:MAG: SIR2 family protein [Ekhidna sp.]|nr:SIR2 family protein [Ekhidna sp.]
MSKTTPSFVPDNLRPYLNEIAERLFSGHAAVMVGAGFSKNATPNSASGSGFPDWSQLGDIFYEKIHGKKPDNQSKYLNVLKLADEVQAAFGRPALDQILRNAIPDDDYEPSSLHKKLLTLPWSDIFTTNYDTLLERARNAVTSKRYEVVVNKEDLINSEKPRIVKLHGSFPSDPPFIITEEDYRCYPENFAPFVNTVRQALLENTLCLIGFSGDDPNFLQWIGWIRDNLGQQNSPKMYLIGPFSLSEAQKKLLERRNIVLVDLSEYPNVSRNHYKALEQFLDYLLSRKAEDNRLGWPEEPEDNELSHPDPQSVKLAQISKLLSVWKKQRLLYPGWVVVPEDRRGSLWAFTEHWINYLPVQDNLPNFIDLEFAFELNWRMEKCLCPILNEQIAFFEAILDRYLPIAGMEMSLEQVSETSEEMNAWELNRSDIRNMCHHLILSMMRYYREEGLLEKWETLRDNIQQDMVNLSSEHKASFHYECALYSFFGLNLPGLKKQLSEWPVNESLPFWEAKRAGLLAEIGQVEESKNILENSLTNIRSKLNLKPITTDYSLVSQEAFVMLLLKYIQTSVGLKEGDWTETQEIQNKIFERWNALKQYKCDPQNELNIFERSLERPPVKRSQITKKKEFDIGRVTQTHHFGGGDSEALTAYNFLHFCEDAGIPFRIPGVTLEKKSTEGTLSRIADYSPYWAMVSMVRIGEEKVVDHIFNRASLSQIQTASVDNLVAQYLKSLEQSIADIRSGDRFYGDNFGVILAKVIPEILSRLCCKCSFEAKEKLLNFLLSVYQSEYRSNYGGIRNLTVRLLRAFSVQQRFDLIPRLIDFPILDNLNPLEEREFINPFQFLNLDRELNQNWNKPIISEKK